MVKLNKQAVDYTIGKFSSAMTSNSHFQTFSFLATYMYTYTQTDAIKHITLLPIRAQGN